MIIPPPRRALLLFSFLLVGLALLPGCRAVDRLPPVLYIGWDADGRNQVFRIDGAGAEPEQLTIGDVERPADVFDFALSPDAKTIAYSLLYDDGGSAIWRMNSDGGGGRELLACPEAECSMLVWSTDNRRLAYERRVQAEGQTASPHLFWLDTKTNETLPLIEGDRYPSYGARFSADGQWIGYVSLPDEGVVVYRERDGTQQRLASYTGMPPAWSSRGAELIISDLELVVYHGAEGDDHAAHSHDYGSAVRLFRVADPATGERSPVSGDEAVDDGAPAWSPDDQWLAFGRRYPDTNSGRQLWLARPDGRDARALTDDPATQHGQPSWSPRGDFLLYQRLPAFEPDARAAIWLMDVDSGQQTKVVDDGYQPVWLARR